ncbi:MAG TPA: sugar ABC transporter permease YjfF [bacterium]|nr:sugar ABC transporter permease YjfF [bacterium]
MISKKHIPLAATLAVFALLYAAASVSFEGFFSVRVFTNLLNDNAFLGLAAIGMTFVILSGGIDLSVGAMIGFTSIFIATMIQRYHVNPIVAIVAALAIGSLLGASMGCLIAWFKLPPFLATLAGMFFARGMGLIISMESIPIKSGFFKAIETFGYNFYPVTTIVFLAVVLIALYVAHFTKFGRGVYAVGGSEDSAMLMGLPVSRIKIMVYTLSGFCSALAGIVYTIYTTSGNATAGTTLEMDAIAAVVIGGTLLTGGVGYVAGTVVGILILGTIQTMITFEGTLSSWWTRIAIGGLLLLFIFLQRFIQTRAQGATRK